MRQVVALRHVADLTEIAVGEVLGISRGTVSSTLRDAYERLSRQIETEEQR
jgi:DNA-directed RNA polymerase specialized sigma24 family protein